MYHRLKLALIPLGLQSFSKNESEEVRMRVPSLSSQVGAVGGARALSSRPGRESYGPAAKQEALVEAFVCLALSWAQRGLKEP